MEEYTDVLPNLASHVDRSTRSYFQQGFFKHFLTLGYLNMRGVDSIVVSPHPYGEYGRTVPGEFIGLFSCLAELEASYGELW